MRKPNQFLRSKLKLAASAVLAMGTSVTALPAHDTYIDSKTKADKVSKGDAAADLSKCPVMGVANGYTTAGGNTSAGACGNTAPPTAGA